MPTGAQAGKILTENETLENPATIAKERMLEEFLLDNWENTELGQQYDILDENGDLFGQQYTTSDKKNRLDILARSKDKKEWLVVELKISRPSDVAVGQTLRYMGIIKDEKATPEQPNPHVRGVIIGLDNDPKLRYALSVVPDISFYKYKVSVSLVKT